MKLNHLNLTVTDVPVTRKFLAEYFGMRDAGGNKNMAFLSDDNGLVLSLTSLKIGRETEVKYQPLSTSVSSRRARRASTRSANA